MEDRDSISASATQYDDRFTVHNYTTATSSTGAGSGELLSSAQSLIKAASTRYQKDAWITVEEERAVVWVPGKLYAYNRRLPQIIVQERPSKEELKEWGAPIAEDEVWSMGELNEFESTDLSGIGNAFEHKEEPRASRKRPRSVDADRSQHDGQGTKAVEAKRVRQTGSREQDVPGPVQQISQSRSPERVDPSSEGSAEKAERPRSTESAEVPETASRPADEGPAAKRRRVDEGPLHGIIPRPHTFLTSMPSESPQPTALKMYKRTIPIILPPYTSPLPEPSEWDRRAWIIPVRGTMPWEKATGAALLDERGGFEADADESYSLGPPYPGAEKAKEILKPIPPTPRSLEPVLWTHEALRAFWEYLKVLRSDGKLGSLGMTFHAAPRYKHGSMPSAMGQGQAWVFDTSSLNSLGPSTQFEGGATGTSGSLGLSSIDYIKIYHDAVQSMFLRTAIDIWQYEVTGNGKEQSTERIRVLKGAKLVLVDHLNEGVMIS